MSNEELEKKVLEMAQPQETILADNQTLKLHLSKQFIVNNVKLQFELSTVEDKTELFQFTFNQDYGIMIKAGDKESFLDLNVFNS